MGIWQTLSALWRTLVDMHMSGDARSLVLLYGVAVGVIVFVCLQVMLVRGRRLALTALRAARDLVKDVRALEDQLDELGNRVERRLDSRTADLDARMTKKLDQKSDLIQERLDQQSGRLAESISGLEGRIGRANDEIVRFRDRVTDVEDRIPGLFDRLDDFRDALAKTFQAELGSVLTSFDASISSILAEMKSELQLGVSRIESIETMVRSRERAERTLLGGPHEASLPESWGLRRNDTR